MKLGTDVLLDGHKIHYNMYMYTQIILPLMHVLFAYWKKQHVNEKHIFLPFEKCAGR